MIRYILLQNRAGKTRLAKYYIPLGDREKRSQEYEVHRLIAGRDAKFTNFVEVRHRESSAVLEFVKMALSPLAHHGGMELNGHAQEYQ